MYDYYLGGKTNYAVDRETGRAVGEAFPAVEVAARANRAFTHRAVRYLAQQGVRQFIDVGAGLPLAPHLHEVVQAVAPDAAVVYVDNDPVVLVYADELLHGSAEGSVNCVEADARRPEEVLAAVERAGSVDFGRPVALCLHALLPFIPEDLDPYAVVGRLVERLAPDSYLSLTHCTGDFAPHAWEAVAGVYGRRGIGLRPRSRAEVLRFFRGLDLAGPGLVTAHRWCPQPADGPGPVTDRQVSVYAGVARKPVA
jgi:SAM-dependent methyltransferase